MLTLLSPAKKMNMDPSNTGLSETRPRFEADTKTLAEIAKTKTAEVLKNLMHISDNLANLNVERFQAFNLEGQSNSSKAAGLAFDGDVYWGFEAKSLSDDDLSFAQDHVHHFSEIHGRERRQISPDPILYKIRARPHDAMDCAKPCRHGGGPERFQCQWL